MRRLVGWLMVIVVMMAGSAPALAQDSGVAQESSPPEPTHEPRQTEPVPVPSPPLDGEVATVVDVIDGDTIRVQRDDGSIERVRYIGIDTPELTDEDLEGAEPYSRQAALANATFVKGEDVVLETDTSDRDRFDRLLRYVWVDSGDGWVMVNEELVALGLAEARSYEPDTRNAAYLRAAEDQAMLTGRGMFDESTISQGLVGSEAMAYLFFDAYEARDASFLRRLMAPGVVYIPPDGERFRGKASVMARFREEWLVLDPGVTIRRSIAQPDIAMLDITVHFGSAVDGPVESTSIDIPAGMDSFKAVALQRWPDDQLVNYRLYLDG